MTLYRMFQNSVSYAPVLLALALAAAMNAPAHAYLGSFSPNDGYDIQSGQIAGDVTYYNAGNYGINAGGGPGPTGIPVDLGLWRLVGPTGVGAYFTTAAARNAATFGGPPYPNPNPNTSATVYLVGNHGPGRNNDGHSLAFRNDTPLGTGAAVYEYDLDQYDMGVNPALITSSASVEFYFRPNAPEETTPSDGASMAHDKFTMTFVDGSGNGGFQWGYLKDSSVVWRNAPGPWIPANIIAADQFNTIPNLWDGVRFDIDFVTDTFSFDYYDVGTNTWSNVVPAGTALANPMQNLTTLRWRLEDNVFGNPFAGKNFFDDFTITGVVPEPSSAVLAAFALMGALCRRGKRAV